MIDDIKTPGSGEAQRNVWRNLERLKPGHDEVKVVICDDEGYRWDRETLERHPVPPKDAVFDHAP